MSNVEWGYISDDAELITPGMKAGEGRCDNGQWGVIVKGAVTYGSLSSVRAWAQSILDQLPPDRDGKPLVSVDSAAMALWLSRKSLDPEWAVDLDQVHEWVEEIGKDSAAAGWTLGEGVADLWVEFDDAGDLTAGVHLAPARGQHLAVGMEPISADDIRVPVKSQLNRVEHGLRVLDMIVDRINRAY